MSRPQPRVQPVEHDARLDVYVAVGHLSDGSEPPARVQHHRAADRLAPLRRARAPREHRNALRPRDLEDRLHVLHRLREDDAERLDLVVRGIGGVAPAAEAVEQDLALERLAQALGEAVRDTMWLGNSHRAVLPVLAE